MIITGFQNYFKQTSNKISAVRNKQLQSFTSDNILLNRDVFIQHDDDTVNQQYLKIYEPGIKTSCGSVNFEDYEKTINELNSDTELDDKWIQNNAGVIKKVFGMDLPDNSMMSEIFLSELNSNRDKITQNIINTFQQDLEHYYRSIFSRYQSSAKLKVEKFKPEALKKYNLAMNCLDYDNAVPENLSLIYRTTTPLPDTKYLQKYTNARIIDVRNEFKAKSLINSFDKHTAEAKTNYEKTGQRSIILINNLYNKSYRTADNTVLYNEMLQFKDNYAAILVTEDLLPRVKTGIPVKIPDFTSIPVYEEDKQKFIKTIIEPIKNNDMNAPKIIIFNSKTTPKDTQEFLQVCLSEIDAGIKILSPATNINDFKRIMADIKEKAGNSGETTFIVIPQAYKYISANSENIELLKSLQYSNGGKIIPVLSSSYPEKLINRMQIEDISGQFTLNRLNRAELEKLLEFYVEKTDDEINDLITLGREIQAPDKNINYKYLAALLNNSSYNGCKEIQNIIEKAKNAYLLSQKQSLNNYISELITGGLNYEN